MSRSTNTFQLSMFSYLFFLFVCMHAVDAHAAYADLNCDGTTNITDIQLTIAKTLNLPLSPVIDADGNGIHDDCPDSLCGDGTLIDVLTGTCLVDGILLQEVEDSAFSEGAASVDSAASFAAGVASVDITSDNADSFAAGVASVDITSDNADSFEAGVASVDITSDNSEAFDAGVASFVPMVLNLGGSDVSGANFSEQNLTNWSLTRGTLNYANMSDATLVNMDFSDSDLVSVQFTGADLSDAKLGGTNLTGVVWSGAICPDSTLADDNGGTCCGHLNGAQPYKGCP